MKFVDIINRINNGEEFTCERWIVQKRDRVIKSVDGVICVVAGEEESKEWLKDTPRSAPVEVYTEFSGNDEIAKQDWIPVSEADRIVVINDKDYRIPAGYELKEIR